MSNYIFTPRSTVPAAYDPYYTRTGSGGLNPCIQGDPEAWPGSALANCVGYTTGRWYEIMDQNPGLCPYDAKYWWSYNDGYQRGSEPKLGAIICFDSSNAGHVAVVESISPDLNSITTSNSAYQQTIYYNQTLYRSNAWTWNSAFTFQGFIYLPDSVVSIDSFAALMSAIIKKMRRKRRP